MNILQLAGSLPRDPQFRAWVEHISVPPQAPTVDEAAEFIRVICGVDSRRQLATDRAAEALFHQHVRRPFLAWREKQLQPA